MHVLFILNQLTFGGCQTQAYNTACYLKKKNIKCSFLGLGGRRSDEDFVRTLESQQVAWSEIQLTKGALNPIAVYTGKIGRTELSAYWKLLKFLRSEDFDVLIPYHRGVCELVSAVSLLTRSNISLIQARDGYSNPTKINSLIVRLSKLSKPLYVANSSHSQEGFSISQGVEESRIHVIRNGICPPEASKSASDWLRILDVDGSCFIAIMVANFFKKKDHATVIKAWSKFVDEHPNSKLVFAGADPFKDQRMTKEHNQVIAELGLEGSIQMLGTVDDIGGLMQVSNVGILSSKIEGAPNVVLECILMGLPFIGTRIPGIVEIVGDDYPLLFDVGDSDELAVLLEDVALGKNRKYVEKLKATVSQDYSVEKMGKAYLELIETHI